VTELDEKWLRSGEKGEAILGAAYIQSLPDLENAVVRGMRSVPFGLNDVKVLFVAILAPIQPLLLRMMPLEELQQRVVKIVF
jgi:hypothetical protein